MSLDARAAEILSRGWYGERLEPEECIYLLSFREKSPIANLTVSLADRLCRRQCAGIARIVAEIDVSTGPCPSHCGFCRWNENICMERFEYMEDEVLRGLCERAGMFHDVTEIRLSAIDGTPVEDLAHFVKVAVSASRRGTAVSIDFGDLGPDGCRTIKNAGAAGAYHSCRIGEGTVTDIKPSVRMDTISNLVDAGFRVTAGTEPIGAETSAKEIVDSFFSTLGSGAVSGEVRGRENVDGSDICSRGTVSPARLAQIKGVLALASAWNSQSASGGRMAQPYLLGKNVAYARYDQKDWRAQTEAARRRLFNAGYDKLLLTEGNTSELGLPYLKQTGSV